MAHQYAWFLLQRTTNLNFTGWTPIATNPGITNGLNQILLPVSSTGNFFPGFTRHKIVGFHLGMASGDKKKPVHGSKERMDEAARRVRVRITELGDDFAQAF